MTTHTINYEEFLRKEFKNLNDLEDFAEKLPTHDKARKMLFDMVTKRRRSLNESTLLLYKNVREQYPNTNVNDSYDLFTKFKITIVMQELDIPNIQLPND